MARRKRSSPSKWNYKGNPTKGQWQFKAPSVKVEESKILDENGIEIDKEKLDLNAIDLDQTIKTDVISPTLGGKEDLGYISQFNFDSQFKRQQKAKSFVDRGLSFVKEDPYGGENKYEFESRRAYDGYWKVERDNDDIQEKVILEVSSPYTYKNKFFQSLDLVKFNPYETIKIRVKAKRYYDFPEKALVAMGCFFPPAPYIPPFSVNVFSIPYTSDPSITINRYLNRLPERTLAKSWTGNKMIATIVSEPEQTIVESELNLFSDHLHHFSDPLSISGGTIRLRWINGDLLHWDTRLYSGYSYYNTIKNTVSYPDFNSFSSYGEVSTIDIKTDFFYRLNNIGTGNVKAYGFKDYYKSGSESARKAFLLDATYPVIPDLDPSVREYDVTDIEVNPAGDFAVRSIVFADVIPNNHHIFPVYFEAEVIIENEKPVVVVKLISHNATFLYTEDDSPGFRTIPTHVF
jgi:hypothetical protein